MTRVNLAAPAAREIRILHDGAAAGKVDRAKERLRPDLRTGLQRDPPHRAVQFFARRRVPRPEDHFVLGAARVEESQSRRVAVYERTRQVELLAKSRAQPGRADALGSDDRIPLQNDGLDPRSGGLARCGPSGRPTAYND